jgi:tetratricopeptide (TPR) repeat protein
MRLSVAMIVKNEEANLGRALASVRGLADEVVIVDTGSTDKTIDIALEHNALVFTFKWCDDFSAARNESLDLCNGDWIMFLDADEAVLQSDHAAIRESMRDPVINIYEHTLRHYYKDGRSVTLDQVPQSCEGDYPLFSDCVAGRLFRNAPGVHFDGRLHEKLCDATGETPSPRGWGDFIIQHYGKTDLRRDVGKQKFYFDIAKKDYQEHPDDDRRLFNYAMQARVAKEWDAITEAVDAYRARGKQAPSAVAVMAGEVAHHQGRHQEALDYFRVAIIVKGINAYVYNRTAVTLAAMGRVDDAKKFLNMAIEASPAFTSSYLVLADIERQSGNYTEAMRIIKSGLYKNPHDPTLIAEVHRCRC